MSKNQSFLNKKRNNDNNAFETKQNKLNKKKKEDSNILESSKKEEINKNEIVIQEIQLRTITTISQYFLQKNSENWKDMQIPELKKYCESIEINCESNFKLLTELINSDIELFFIYYSKYQFTLEINQRKSIQKLIKNCDNYPLIKNNLIKDEIKSIRELFFQICKLILNIPLYEEGCVNNLETQLINNGVYINDNIEFLIPVTFGNIELKFNKLIIDIVYFLFGKNMGNLVNLENDKMQLIKTKISVFKETKIFFQKANVYGDEVLFKICDYLINCYYILFDVDDILKDNDILRKIISCCLPFELVNAINFINESKEYSSNVKFEIDNEIFYKYDTSKLTKDSTIKLSHGIKVLEIKAEDINWNIKPNIFFELFSSDNFMLCFRFPKFNEINFICLNKEINNNYKFLLKKMLKSKIMEQCMNIDSDTNNFRYPFNNDDIINELEEHTLFVPFPAKNFYGYSDRMSFTIFLNSNISQFNLKSTFIDYDNLFKSQCHEIKHIYRLYIHINEPKISLKTPEINRKSLSRNKLIRERITTFQQNKDNLSKLYDQRIIEKSENDKLDYGDILEFAMNGDKQDVFFIKGSLFCLDEKSWDMEPKNFFVSFFNNCNVKKFTFNPNKESLFINSVINFFGISRKLLVTNETNYSKRAVKKLSNFSFGEEIENTYIIKPKMNHCGIKK